MDAKLTHLNPHYTFENYLEGECNAAAVQAARIAVVRTHESYNPLFVRGGHGTGKTHLLHAIGNAIQAVRPEVTVCYRTAEDFTNGLIKLNRAGGLGVFRNNLRNIGVLLLDHVEFLEGKKFTQEEFIFAFDQLRDSERLIVLTGVLRPDQMNGIRADLRRRFSMGQVVELEPHDHGVKISAFATQTTEATISITTDAAEYVVQMASTIAEVRAIATKLKAYCLMHGGDLTPEIVMSVLRNWEGGRPSRVALADAERILDQRLRQWNGTEVAGLFNKPTFRNQVLMYLANTACRISSAETGRLLKKHHATVRYAVSKMQTLRKENADLNNLLGGVELELSALFSSTRND